MPGSTRTPRRVADRRHARGLIDTSVLIDLEQIESIALPFGHKLAQDRSLLGPRSLAISITNRLSQLPARCHADSPPHPVARLLQERRTVADLMRQRPALGNSCDESMRAAVLMVAEQAVHCPNGSITVANIYFHQRLAVRSTALPSSTTKRHGRTTAGDLPG